MKLSQDELDIIANNMKLEHEGLFISDGDIRNNRGRIVVYDFSDDYEVEDEDMLKRIINVHYNIPNDKHYIPNVKQIQMKSDILKFNDDEIYNTHSMRIAADIIRALNDQGITQKDLAKKLNVTPQQVNKYVKGTENLTLNTITTIEKALNIDIIFKNEVIPSRPEMDAGETRYEFQPPKK